MAIGHLSTSGKTLAIGEHALSVAGASKIDSSQTSVGHIAAPFAADCSFVSRRAVTVRNIGQR